VQEQREQVQEQREQQQQQEHRLHRVLLVAGEFGRLDVLFLCNESGEVSLSEERCAHDTWYWTCVAVDTWQWTAGRTSKADGARCYLRCDAYERVLEDRTALLVVHHLQTVVEGNMSTTAVTWGTCQCQPLRRGQCQSCRLRASPR